MVESFQDGNYYDILKVSADAGTSELKRAYRDALAIYDDDALATYSLFSDDQRAELLAVIESAYQTLLDTKKRAVYNQMLLDSGQVEPSFFPLTDQKQLSVRAQAQSHSASLATWIRKKSRETNVKVLIDALKEKERVSGADLRGIREALGIDASEIYDIAKISSTVLSSIENDCFDDLPTVLYIKQFLSSLAEILQLDPMHIVNGYLKNMDRH